MRPALLIITISALIPLAELSIVLGYKLTYKVWNLSLWIENYLIQILTSFTINALYWMTPFILFAFISHRLLSGVLTKRPNYNRNAMVVCVGAIFGWITMALTIWPSILGMVRLSDVPTDHGNYLFLPFISGGAIILGSALPYIYRNAIAAKITTAVISFIILAVITIMGAYQFISNISNQIVANIIAEHGDLKEHEILQIALKEQANVAAEYSGVIIAALVLVIIYAAVLIAYIRCVKNRKEENDRCKSE